MAQLTLTLSQEELLVLLSGERKNAFWEMVQNLFNSILQAESQQYLKLPLMNALKSARTAVMSLASVPFCPVLGPLPDCTVSSQRAFQDPPLHQLKTKKSFNDQLYIKNFPSRCYNGPIKPVLTILKRSAYVSV